DIHDHLTINTPKDALLTIPTQRAWLTFDALAGHEYSVVGQNVSGTCMFWPLSVLRPDLSTWETTSTCGAAFLDRQPASTTGPYTVLVDPNGTAVGTARPTVYDVVDIAAGALVLNSSGITTPFTIPGQKALFTFDAVAGRRYSIFGENFTAGCL